ncbi:MAG TPA: alanine--glyoxylate aminotransferase family protein [Polyangia bacterium]|jgi:aspartate aminotransferase-like enzyme
MPIKTYLLTPGPTPVPERVMLAMARPIVHHRTADFERIFREAAEGLQWIYQTKQPVLMLAGSGTLAMEAAVVNTMKRGDKALCVVGGKFGERWRNLCKAHGLELTSLDVEWGRAVDPAAVEKALDADDKITAVFSQANESSTGVRHPVEAIAKITQKRERVINVVDAVSALGAFDLPMDAAGFDVLLTGSQKALMLPPGQAYIALSDKAWARTESADLPRFYCDLKREKKAQAGGETAWTPAITLTVGLAEALRMIKEEGLQQCFARHSRLAAATRAACVALGCALFAPDAPSPTVTAVRAPETPNGPLDTGKLVKQLRDKYGVSITGGQDAVKGKIFRVAHLGYFDTFDILTSVAAIEMALVDLGVKIAHAAGTAAAQAVLRVSA